MDKVTITDISLISLELGETLSGRAIEIITYRDGGLFWVQFYPESFWKFDAVITDGIKFWEIESAPVIRDGEITYVVSKGREVIGETEQLKEAIKQWLAI